MCLIIHIITSALADNVFKEGYSTVNAVYNTEIPMGIQQILLKWKTNMMDLAIFLTMKKGEITRRALPYYSLVKNWRKFILDAGFEVPPLIYTIQRDTANVLNSIYLTSDEDSMLILTDNSPHTAVNTYAGYGL